MGIPDYTGALPIEYTVRCLCARRYLVFTGMGQIVGDSRARAKQRAEEMKATFVDSRVTLFLQCSCGQVFDFMPNPSLIVN